MLTGPRAVAFQEIHELVCRTTGQDVKLVEITPADIGRAALDRGGEQWEADHFTEMYTLFRAGESAYVTDDVARLVRRAPRTVEDYVRDNRELFRAGEPGVGGSP